MRVRRIGNFKYRGFAWVDEESVCIYKTWESRASQETRANVSE